MSNHTPIDPVVESERLHMEEWVKSPERRQARRLVRNLIITVAALPLLLFAFLKLDGDREILFGFHTVQIGTVAIIGTILLRTAVVASKYVDLRQKFDERQFKSTLQANEQKIVDESEHGTIRFPELWAATQR